MNEPRIPNIGEYVRGVGRLKGIETIQPKPPEPITEYIFEDVSAKCELRLNGEIINELESLNDFYGEGTGIETAIEEMTAYANKRNLSSKSELEVVVIKVIEQHRMEKSDGENFYDGTFPRFEYTREYRLPPLPDTIEEIVWSSKSLPDKENK